MNSKRVLAAVLCAVSLAGIGYVGAQSAGIAGLNPKEEAGAGQRGFSLQTTTRGNIRSLYLTETISAGGNTTAMVTAASEVDVSSATFALRAVPVTAQANLNIYLAWQSPTGFPINVLLNSGGTTHLQFDPPIPARAGDTISMFASSFPGSTQFIVEVVFNGTVPVAPVEPGDFLEVH